MNRRIKITSRERVTVYGEDDRAPFWLEHLLGIIVVGLIVVVGAMVVLSLSDWGRAVQVWLGLGLSAVMTGWLAIDPWRSFRTGEPTAVWAGEALSALGWSGMTFSLAAGLPFCFWAGMDGSAWLFAIPGAGTIVFTAIAFVGMRIQTSQPLPALDDTPRSARVTFNADDSEGGQHIEMRYLGADGEKHHAELADMIDDSWVEKFTQSTTWQIYTFRDTALADTVVFLTEAHDEVWRDGWKLDGVRLGGESGPVRPGPGSPFLREDSKWRFES